MLRILIVDDEAAILGMLKLVLESESFQIETARSATQALLSLKEKSFDVVLTDMRMETPTAGYEVIRAARQLQPRPAIAILTAFPISASEWRPSGADAMLVKGSDLLSLPNTLRSLSKIQAQKAAASDSVARESRRAG